jgi:cytochrome P450
LLSFLSAAHDTSAATACTILFAISSHKNACDVEFLALLRNECQSLDWSKSIEYDTIVGLPYLDAFCSEILRMYTPVPGMLRNVAVEGVQIGGFSLPKGSNVLLNWSFSHYDESNFADPFVFNPKRWLKTSEEKIKPGIF